MKRKIILVALMATIASTVIIGQKFHLKIPLEVKQSFENLIQMQKTLNGIKKETMLMKPHLS